MLTKPQEENSPSFKSEKHYKRKRPLRIFTGVTHQIPSKVRPCNAQRKYKNPKSYISVSMLNGKLCWCRGDDLGFFLATEPGYLAVTDSHGHFCILKLSRVKREAIFTHFSPNISWQTSANIWAKMGHEQDNEPKHSSKSTPEWLKKVLQKIIYSSYSW